MKNCLFCDIQGDPSRVAKETELSYASYDHFPVTPRHCLIIPKRHIETFFELSDIEMVDIKNLINEIRYDILNKDDTVEGFNIGVNSGKVAGQSIFHLHVHLIPRRVGDLGYNNDGLPIDPRGGVRGVIPNKRTY